MINYPNGKTFSKKENLKNKTQTYTKLHSSANRGMDLENSINISNDYYLQEGIALITKRPTPINVVKVDYSRGAKITDAYFEKQSTTDYNGVYKGKYMDFEAKNTRQKTSFPLANIHPHQIQHLKNVLLHKGIAFFIIQLEELGEVYLLDAKYVIDFYDNSPRRSIPISNIKKYGSKLKQGINPRIDYISTVEEIYFKD